MHPPITTIAYFAHISSYNDVMLLSVMRVKNGPSVVHPLDDILHEHINFVVMIKTFLTTEHDCVTVVDPPSRAPPPPQQGKYIHVWVTTTDLGCTCSTLWGGGGGVVGVGIVGGKGLGQEIIVGMWVVFTGNGWLPPANYQGLWEAKFHCQW